MRCTDLAAAVARPWTAPILLALVLGACTGAVATPSPTASAVPSVAAPTAAPSVAAATSSASSAPSATPRRTTYPVTIAGCAGRTLTFQKAPERVVTFDPAVTEIMLTLGFKDRIVGVTLFDDGPAAGDKMWSVTKADMLSLKVINDPKVGYPSREAVVAARPDLVASEYTSAFDPSYGVGTFKQFDALGIPAYVTHGGCEDAPPIWTDLSVIYQDIRDFGVIFDVQDKADAEIASLQAQVAAIQAKARAANLPDHNNGMYCCGPDNPGTLGTTVANALITLAGSHYAFLNEDNGRKPLSWEAFVKGDPDVIWIITGLGEAATTAEDFLAKSPRTAAMTAVKAKRYLVVAYDDVGETPRTIDGLRNLVDGLIALQGQ
ncbi:MAG: ABC transporter substrate-binding protein [Chloroflexota bacterium]